MDTCISIRPLSTQIAAASLEKLFQQLTSPAMFRDDFMEVFLMTHSCFTTPKEVLTALLNCVKSPDDTWSDSSSQVSAWGDMCAAACTKSIIKHCTIVLSQHLKFDTAYIYVLVVTHTCTVELWCSYCYYYICLLCAGI